MLTIRCKELIVSFDNSNSFKNIFPMKNKASNGFW